MATTTDQTLRVACQGDFRRDVDADKCTVSVKLLVSGSPSGSNLILDGDAATAPEMTQYHPGHFTYTTSGAPFTRGETYRATYTPYIGGTSQDTITQDFTAYTDTTSAVPPAAQHYYTTLNARNIVRASLGIQQKTSTVAGQEPGSASSLDIVNDAHERVWRDHRFQFQLGEPVYIDLIADQSRYQLPVDFMELQGITKPNDHLVRWTPKPWEWIRNARERSFVNPVNEMYYCVVSDPPDTLTGFTRYALEVFPTPSSFIESGAVIDYYRECPKVVSDSDIPPFPIGMFSLLKQAYRIEAFEQENDPRAPGEVAKYERLLDAAKRHDSRHMPTNLGSLVRGRYGDPMDNFDLYHDSGWEIP